MARHVRDDRHERDEEHGAWSVREDDRRSVRDRFGGFDFPATLAGLFSAVGVLVILGGLFAAAGNFGYTRSEGEPIGDQLEGQVTDEVAIGGLIAGFLTLLVAFLVGGWVAGRVARYDGGRNGLLTALWFVLAAAGFAVLGTWAGDRYDVFADVELPAWFSGNELTIALAVTAAVGIAIALLAGWFGGKLGERYHRRADDEVMRDRTSETRHETVVSGRGDSDVTDARRVEQRRN